LGDFILFFQGTKNGHLVEPKLCWGIFSKISGRHQRYPSTSGKLQGRYRVFGKFQGTPNFFPLGDGG
jgi:hypothetical protein